MPFNAQRPAIIASRGSKLALWQANHVQSLLSNLGVPSKVMVIKTTGDRVQDRFLHEIGGKGLFVREIEQALAEKKADLAVHSLKDLPAKTPEPFRLTAVLRRHRPTDLVIWHPKREIPVSIKGGLLTADAVKAASALTIATGSLRRTCLLKNANARVDVIGIRGNVDTRIEKLGASDWDGLILAEASLERLDLLSSHHATRLDPSWFTPSAAQGALVIETTHDHEINPIIAGLNCQDTNFHVSIERRVLERLGGDCTMPFGCHVSRQNDLIRADAVILNMQGVAVRATCEWPTSLDRSVDARADDMIAQLHAHGADRILGDLGIPSPF